MYGSLREVESGSIPSEPFPSHGIIHKDRSDGTDGSGSSDETGETERDWGAGPVVWAGVSLSVEVRLSEYLASLSCGYSCEYLNPRIYLQSYIFGLREPIIWVE